MIRPLDRNRQEYYEDLSAGGAELSAPLGSQIVIITSDPYEGVAILSIAEAQRLLDVLPSAIEAASLRERPTPDQTEER